MLICEELFLLLTDRDGKQKSNVRMQAQALNCAVLSDLVIANLVAFSTDRYPKVVPAPIPPAGTSHPILVEAAKALSTGKPRRARDIIMRDHLHARDLIGNYWVHIGYARKVEKRWLGMIPARYIVAQHSAEDAVRTRLVSVLRGVSTAQISDAILLSILKEIRGAHRMFRSDVPELKRKEVRTRIDKIVEQTGAAHFTKPVKQAIAQLNASMAAVAATGAITAGSS